MPPIQEGHLCRTDADFFKAALFGARIRPARNPKFGTPKFNMRSFAVPFHFKSPASVS